MKIKFSERLRWGEQLRNSWTCSKPWTWAMAAWLTEVCLITTVTGPRTITRTSPSFSTSTETVITMVTTGDLANRCWRSGCRAPSLKTEGECHGSMSMLTSLYWPRICCLQTSRPRPVGAGPGDWPLQPQPGLQPGRQEDRRDGQVCTCVLWETRKSLITWQQEINQSHDNVQL